MRMFLRKVLAYVVGVLFVIMVCIILMYYLLICVPIAVVACLIMGYGLDEMFDKDVKKAFKLLVETVKEKFKSIKES